MISIYNNENILTNKQIKRILKLALFGDEYNLKIYINEKRIDILRNFHGIFSILNEGQYSNSQGIINVNLYNLEGNSCDKRLYGIGVMLHELKHHELLKNRKYKPSDEIICDNYAKKFLNLNSQKIKEILGLRDEYEILEF